MLYLIIKLRIRFNIVQLKELEEKTNEYPTLYADTTIQAYALWLFIGFRFVLFFSVGGYRASGMSFKTS